MKIRRGTSCHQLSVSFHAPLVVDSVFEADAPIGLLHFPDRPGAECLEILIADLHARRQHIHHHVDLHRQLEEQTGDAVLTVLDGPAHGGHQRGRQVRRGLLARNIASVEADCLVNLVVLALAVIPFTEFLDQPLRFGRYAQSKLDFFPRHTFLQSKCPDLRMVRASSF